MYIKAAAKPARFHVPCRIRTPHPSSAGSRKIPPKMSMALRTTRPEIGAPAFSPILATRKGPGRNNSHIPMTRRRTFSGWAYAQASSCGTRRIAVSVKSTMKMRSQAGRDHSSGDQIFHNEDEVPSGARPFERRPNHRAERSHQVEQDVAEDAHRINSRQHEE